MSEVTRAVATGAHRTDERASSNTDPHGEFHVPMATYVMVFVALMVLLILTVAAAYVPLGFLNMPVAMAIASVKAVLVILYFMHVKFASRLTKVFVAGSFLWLAILFVMAFGDYYTRGWSPNSHGWEDQPVKAAYDTYADQQHGGGGGHAESKEHEGTPDQPHGTPGATTTTTEDHAQGRPGAG
jgi:cytochrome c oxidase subunit 4